MDFNLAFYLSLFLAASSCFGLLLAGRGKWQGWAVGLVTQPVWASYAIITKGYGLLLTCAMFTTVYTKNLIKWRRQAKAMRFQGRSFTTGFQEGINKAMKDIGRLKTDKSDVKSDAFSPITEAEMKQADLYNHFKDGKTR